MQRYCILCKKAGMSEWNYMSHSSEDFFGKRSDNISINYELGRYQWSRSNAVKQCKKSENKWKKELKDLNKKNKLIYSIAKKSGLRCELKIRSSWSGTRLPRNMEIIAATLPATNPILVFHIQRYQLRWREVAFLREIKILDHTVFDNIKTNKDQHNEDIENKLDFHHMFNLSSSSKDPLSILPVRFQGAKK